MLDPKKNHLGDDVVEVSRAERTGETHVRLFVVADADEVDVALAVDLAAGEEEHVDTALSGAVEQLAPAIGKEHVVAAAEQRHVRPPATALAQRQRGER